MNYRYVIVTLEKASNGEPYGDRVIGAFDSYTDAETYANTSGHMPDTTFRILRLEPPETNDDSDC